MSAYDYIETIDALKAERDKIVQRRSKGVLQWTYNGQTRIYNSPREMLLVIEEMTREIRRRVAASMNLKPVGPWEGFGVVYPLAPIAEPTPPEEPII